MLYMAKAKNFKLRSEIQKQSTKKTEKSQFT
jgi:hypothetical protein